MTIKENRAIFVVAVKLPLSQSKYFGKMPFFSLLF